jgi:hypothetical protein
MKNPFLRFMRKKPKKTAIYEPWEIEVEIMLKSQPLPDHFLCLFPDGTFAYIHQNFLYNFKTQ